eukprot:255793-Chlamydomonas_euryale.AAC.1
MKACTLVHDPSPRLHALAQLARHHGPPPQPSHSWPATTTCHHGPPPRPSPNWPATPATHTSARRHADPHPPCPPTQAPATAPTHPHHGHPYNAWKDLVRAP